MERMPSQESKKRLLSGSSPTNNECANDDRNRAQQGSPSIAGWMALASTNGIVQMQDDPEQMKSYARNISSRERSRATGKARGNKNSLFSPCQITQKLSNDSGTDDLWHKQTSGRASLTRDSRGLVQKVTADLQSQAGIYQWNYRPLSFLPNKSETEAAREFAHEILAEKAAAQAHRKNTFRDSGEIVDCEVQGQMTRLEQRPPGTPRSALRKADKSTTEDLHDFLCIQTSPKLQGPSGGDGQNSRGTPQGSQTQEAIARHKGEIQRLDDDHGAENRRTLFSHPAEDAHRFLPRACDTELIFQSEPATSFSRVSDPANSNNRYSKATGSDHTTDHQDLQLRARAFTSRLKHPHQIPSSVSINSNLSDAAIKARAHFTLTYTAETDATELHHVERTRSTHLWTGEWAEVEHLVYNLQENLCIQKFQGLEYRRRRPSRMATSSSEHTYNDKPDTTLRQWLVEAEKAVSDGFSETNGDVRSLHFLPTGVLRQLVEVKSQLFAPLAKQRSQTSFSDGRCSLLTGKISNLEYVKGVVLRCPANPAANAATMSATGLKVKNEHACHGLRVASEVTMDLILGHGSWSKEVLCLYCLPLFVILLGESLEATAMTSD